MGERGAPDNAQTKESSIPTREESNDAPLDEEIGRLIGKNETEQHQRELQGKEDDKESTVLLCAFTTSPERVTHSPPTRYSTVPI